MTISGILGKENIARLRVRIEAPAEIYDGVPTLFTVRLENPRRFLPAFLIRVTLLEQNATFVLIGGRAADSAGLTATLRGRGHHSLGPAQICSIFPINFFVRCRRLPVENRVVVFPAPRRCPPLASHDRQGRQGRRPATARGQEGEVSRIGEYRGGEPLKLIHWKLSARHEGLKVKELSATSCEPVVIDLADLAGGLEERIGCAAYLVRELLRRGRPVGLRLGGRLLPPAAGQLQQRRLLTELALHDVH